MFLLSDRYSQYVDESTVLSVLGHGLNFIGGAFATDAQLLPDFPMFSMSLSIPG